MSISLGTKSLTGSGCSQEDSARWALWERPDPAQVKVIDLHRQFMREEYLLQDNVALRWRLGYMPRAVTICMPVRVWQGTTRVGDNEYVLLYRTDARDPLTTGFTTFTVDPLERRLSHNIEVMIEWSVNRVERCTQEWRDAITAMTALNHGVKTVV
ncbi:MAG: hypothetical protein M1272_01055 [Firmicutes bacterium]|nr:hypothetical protein [Bacillota bacterium]